MGMCLGIDGMIGLYVILIITALTILTDYVALASIIGYVGFPIFVALWPDIFFNDPEVTYNIYVVSLALLVSTIGIWKHRNNISNMLAKKETGLRSVVIKHSK